MNKSTRRAFLAGAGTIFAAVVAEPLLAAIPSAPASDKGANDWLTSRPQSEFVSQFQFTPGTFQGLVDKKFEVVDDKGQHMVLQLDEVRDLKKQNPHSAVAFALNMSLVSGRGFPQGTYEFSNPQLGKFLLFVVASTSNHGSSYVAIINRV